MNRNNVVTPLVYAHRGASAAAPENTLEAYRLARDLGADGVEVDVRRSADGALVLHHDALLPDGRIVASTPRSELPATVPTLAEALDVCAGLVVNIEIKNIPHEPDFDRECRLAREVVALLVDRGRLDTVLVSSFHLRTIDRVKALDPTISTGFLTFIDPLPSDGVVLAADRGHDALHPHDATIDGEVMAAAHAAGLQVNAWTVDEPTRMAGLAELGVGGVITNVPDLARRVLGSSSRS